MVNMLNIILNASRGAKRVITLALDSCFIVFSFWASLFIRLDDFSSLYNPNHWLILSGLLPISIIIFIRLGLYR
ncbi:MAG: hypothetical protein ACI83B_002519, partial [Sediminicola sp.]